MGGRHDSTRMQSQTISSSADQECQFFCLLMRHYYTRHLLELPQLLYTLSLLASTDNDKSNAGCRIPLGEDQPHLEILPEVIRNYGLAVQYGHRHIFQSLPRLLTLWFDFGTHIKSITVTQKV